MRYLLLFSLIFSSILCYAIDYNMDSLANVCKEDEKLNLRAYELRMIHYSKNQPDILLEIGQELLERSLADRNEMGEMLSYVYLGDYYSERGFSSLALDKLIQAKSYYEKNAAHVELVNVYSIMGNVHYRKGQYKEASKWYLKSSAKGEELENVWMTYMAKLNLARCYFELNESDKGLMLVLDFIDVVQTLDQSTELTNAYNVLGGYYQSVEKYDLAESCFKEAIQISEKMNDVINIAHGYNNMAITYFFQNKMALSKDYFFKALNKRIETGSLLMIAESYYNIGDWFFEQALNDSARFYYNKALLVAENAEAFGLKADVVLQLVELEKNQRNFEKALEYSQLYSELREHAYVLTNEEEMALLEFDRILLDKKRNEKIYQSAKENEAKMSVFDIRNRNLLILLFATLLTTIFLLLLRIYKDKQLLSPRK
jgi:tetratricopeptide (TPR) repeat protein